MPPDAKDWGYKVLTQDRKSGCHPAFRSYGCEDNKLYLDKGKEITYPENQTVLEPNFCTCTGVCCKGLHYFQELRAAFAFRKELWYLHSEERNTIVVPIVVRCIVPNKARLSVKKQNNTHKGRADMLTTLQQVNNKGKICKE